LVNASIARSLRPSRAAEERRETTRHAIWQAISNLPLYMRWNDEWNARARKIAVEALDGAHEDVSPRDLAAIADVALRPLIAEYNHREKIEAAMKFVYLPDGNREEQEDARDAVRAALVALPIGANDRQIEKAKQSALVPIQARIRTRRQREQEEHQHQVMLAAKESLVQAGLREIYRHARMMLHEFEYDDTESPWALEDRVKGEVEKQLREKLYGNENEQDVIEIVHEVMEEAEGWN